MTVEKSIDVAIHIRKNSSGEIRIWKDALFYFDGSEFPSIFIWEDGNYSCDCNRHVFFSHAGGEDADFSRDCSDTEYSVNIYDGDQLIYSEFDAVVRQNTIAKSGTEEKQKWNS